MFQPGARLSDTRGYGKEETSSYQNAALMAATINQAAEGIIVFDERCRILLINQAARDTFRLEDRKATHVLELFDPASPGLETFHQALRDETSKMISGIYGCRQESSFPLEINCSHSRLDGRHIIIAIVRDISRRMEIDRMKNEFISMVSHELRTPLTSIRGSLGLISGGALGELPSSVREMVRIACSNSERLVRLINDILDIEKIEAGMIEFRREWVDARWLLYRAFDENKGLADSQNIKLVMNDIPRNHKVRIDVDRILQVLANLISNAVHHSPPEEQVVISARVIEQTMSIRVTDSGPGIPESFQPRIFEKFVQADSSATRKQGGSGLGLSICRSIVEQHGGAIGFESRPGRTSFFFRLPEYREPMPEEPVGTLPTKNRILICENEPDVAFILREMLRQEGYGVDLAFSAGETLSLLETNDYKAMTLDLKLPDHDGVALIRDLREKHGHALPIIVISVIAEDVRKSLNGEELGVMGWIDKPIDRNHLIQALRRSILPQEGLPRILHVEDDEDVRSFIKILFHDLAEVVQAPTYEEAVEIIHQETYHLVLLDPGLPDGDGLDLLTHIRRHNPAVPTVLFTARDLASEQQGHAVHTLLKSQTSNQKLLETVQNLIMENPKTI